MSQDEQIASKDEIQVKYSNSTQQARDIVSTGSISASEGSNSEPIHDSDSLLYDSITLSHVTPIVESKVSIIYSSFNMLIRS
jgi:hypothetical protein